MEKIQKKFKNSKERFKYFLETQGKTKNNFYEISGMSNGLLDKEGGLNEDSLLKICNVYPEISLDWLLLEKGGMIRRETEKTVAMATAPQAIANTGELNNLASPELVEIIISQQESIKSLSSTLERISLKF